MADKVLVNNVLVGDKWYGPAYPENKVTSDVAGQITNPGAWGEPEPEQAEPQQLSRRRRDSE